MSRAISPLETSIVFEFPEVEALPPPNESRKTRRPGDALKHFRQVAVRVMTSLALGQDPFQNSESLGDDGSKDDQQNDAKKVTISEEPKTMESKRGRRGSHVAWGPTATGATARRQSIKPPVRKKSTVEPLPTNIKGSRFASLVRLARFRKMSFRGIKEEEEESKKKKEDQYKVEEEIVLPQKPRFCTSMSLEAQYAMFKGYEDVLLSTFDTMKKDRREALYRVRTPHKMVTSLHLAEEDRSHTHHSVMPATTKLTIPPLPANLSRTSSISGKLNKETIAVPKDKQLRLTSRFERAQDILDTIRLSQGNLVTSPRAIQKIAPKPTNPVETYNAWSHSWAREFKLQYGKPKTHITTIK